MLCRMCLIESEDLLKIFTDKTCQSKIALMIAQHFWFELKIDDPVSNMLCVPCWHQIEIFHKYYQSIEEAQRKLSEGFPIKVEPPQNPPDIEMQEFLKIEQETDNMPDMPDREAVDCLEGLGEPTVDGGNCSYAGTQRKFEEHFVGEEKIVVIKVVQKDDTDSEIDSDSEPLINHVRKRRKPSTTEDIEEEDAYIPSQESSSESAAGDYEKPVVEMKKRRPRKSQRKATKAKTTQSARKKSESIQRKNSEYQKTFEEDEEKIRNTVPLKCDLCCQCDMKCFADVKRHYREQHDARGYISCCNKKLYKRVQLLDHVYLHLNPEHFKCEICNKTYVDKQGLKNHMFRHEANESNAFKCEHCPRLFAKSYLLHKHSLIHAPPDQRQNFCEDCGKGFPSHSQKEIHRRYVHNKSAGQMCHICAKVIRDKKLFTKHQLKHAGVVVPKVQCKVCGAWLFQENMRKHMKLHNEDSGDHVCSICGKLCPSKVAMRSHIRYAHVDQPIFNCSICKRTFKKAVNLKEHMTTHTGEVLYTCPHCPKTFNSNANMHSHRKKIHPKEWAEARRFRGIPQPGFSKSADNQVDSSSNNVTVGENSLENSDESSMNISYNNFI